MLENESNLSLEDAQAALSKVRAADAKKRTTIDALEAERDALQGQVTTYEAHGTPEQIGAQLATLTAALGGLEKAGIDVKDPAALGSFLESLPARLERAGKADELEVAVARTKAAQAVGVPEDSLNEWLGDRKPTLGKVKDAAGVEMEVYGIGSGESFKPLSGFSTLAALKGQTIPAPAVLPAAFTGVGGQREAAQILTPAEKVLQSKLSSGDYNI